MAQSQTNVSNGVLTIIASFSNGLDVLKKLRRSERKKRPSTTTTAAAGNSKRSNKRQDEDARRLSRSLRQGPEDIGREYQARSVCCDGEKWAVGDATAQTSLAEILLKLNTGLVGIIASFLNRDRDRDARQQRLDLDYKSLTDLSEHSREQTVGVLRQLYQRLRMKSIPSQPKRPGQNARRSKSRHPTLARVLIENSSLPSQIALVRPSEAKKSHSQLRSSSKARSKPSAPLPPAVAAAAAAAAAGAAAEPPPPPYFPSDPLPRPHHQQRQHSTTSFSKPKPRPELKHKASSHPPPTPPTLLQKPSKANLPSTEVPPTRPQTFYSLASGSTKLGEIPMHKWAEPWDQAAAEEANRKALEGGWPVVYEGVGGEDRRKKGWRRWFGRGREV